MKMRNLNKLNIDVSLLGFGCMRFPITQNGEIDEVEAEKMIDKAIATGVNYIDTAYPYHNGASEPFVGRVLKKYPRDSFYLTTKLPMWSIETKEDVERIFNDQLKRLDVEYVDFYLLHALNKNTFKKVVDLGVIDICEKYRREGKIKYLGFSFHDEYEVFEEIISHYDWDFCQIQFNYMDTLEQAGLKGYNLAKNKNIPLVIMEPIKGGLLAKLPTDIHSILANLNKNASDASYALRYVGSFDNVKVILSGMSTMEQVVDNLNTFNNFVPLSSAEFDAIDKVVKELNSRIKNGCTGCRYCMPCPKGVNIPSNFAMWNEYGIYDNKESFVERCNALTKREVFANSCVECGLCEKACPQNLEIRKDLKKIIDDFNKLR